jgi:hypothetical protein
MYFRSFVFHLIMAVLLLCGSILAGESGAPSRELRIPKDPDVPAVDIDEKKDKGNSEGIPVTVVTVKGEAMTGSLIPDFDVLEIDVMDNGTARKESIPLVSIDTIEFTHWHGTELRKNEFAFYPSQTRITMKDKKAYVCGRNIAKLNKLLFKDFRGNRFVFSYFYDYRKNNVWKNSGEAEMRYPETNPPVGTLLRIMFMKMEEKNILERLLFK